MTGGRAAKILAEEGMADAAARFGCLLVLPSLELVSIVILSIFVCAALLPYAL